MDSQIRYLAIVSEQPDTLARFYSTYFSMRELGRSDAGDIALTDGFYNISLLKPRNGAAERGISHLGITIDDIGQIETRLRDFAPKTDIRQEEGGLFHGDYSVTDPYGQVVSLSTHQFHTPKVERSFPCIRHIAVCVPNNDEVLDFYVNVFGFRESTTSKKIRVAKPGRAVGSGWRDRHGHFAGSRAPRHERTGKPEGRPQSLWLAGDRYRAFPEFFAGGLHQSTTEQPAHGRVPRLRSGPKPLRRFARQGLRDRRRSLGARIAVRLRVLI